MLGVKLGILAILFFLVWNSYAEEGDQLEVKPEEDWTFGDYVFAIKYIAGWIAFTGCMFGCILSVIAEVRYERSM